MPLTDELKRWLDAHPELRSSPGKRQRKVGHDYRSRCIYLVTLCVDGRDRMLGELSAPDEYHRIPHVVLSALGKVVLKVWNDIPSHYPAVRVLKLQVMPDHVHGILFFTEPVPYHLGQVINGFKKGCNDAVKASSDGRFRKLWEDSYDDTILTDKWQLKHMTDYLADNPRRLWVRNHNGELFTKMRVTVAGSDAMMMGNAHLLSYEKKLYVQCTNRLSGEELEQRKRNFIAKCEEGYVPVTAGISKVEKAVKNWALENGHEMILVTDDGMGELWKPTGRLFDACGNGKLLIVAMGQPHRYSRTIKREVCLMLNEKALAITEGRFSHSQGGALRDSSHSQGIALREVD